MNRPGKQNQHGIALLIVLWVMAVLIVMALSFSVLTRSHSYELISYTEGVKNKYLAEAGQSRGIMEIIYRQVHQNQTVTFTGSELWRTDGASYSVSMRGGGYAVRIVDEAGKISLNGMTDGSGVILKNLLIGQGVSPEESDIIVDSILDWKDADDLHRLNGAENDYYQSLSKPYKARDANFETLDELLLVRGMTPRILYGGDKKKGMIQFLSLAHNSLQIDVNVAPEEVLAALPGMNADMVKRLLELRMQTDLRQAQDARDILADSYAVMAPYVVFARGVQKPAYTIESEGFPAGKKAGYAIMATVIFDGSANYHYVYYKSPVVLNP